MNPAYLSMNRSAAAATVASNINGVSGDSATPAATPTAGELVPEPKPTGDVGLMIATMVIEDAFARRQESRADRKTAMDRMIAAQDDQIAQMRSAADQRYAAAQMEAWGKVAEGGLGVCGGVVSSGALDSTRNLFLANEGMGRAYESLGKVADGVSGLLATSVKHAADLADANAKAAEKEATAEKGLVDDEDDRIKETRDDVKTALDFLRDYQSTQNKSMSSAIKA